MCNSVAECPAETDGVGGVRRPEPDGQGLHGGPRDRGRHDLGPRPGPLAADARRAAPARRHVAPAQEVGEPPSPPPTFSSSSLSADRSSLTIRTRGSTLFRRLAGLARAASPSRASGEACATEISSQTRGCRCTLALQVRETFGG